MGKRGKGTRGDVIQACIREQEPASGARRAGGEASFREQGGRAGPSRPLMWDRLHGEARLPAPGVLLTPPWQ